MDAGGLPVDPYRFVGPLLRYTPTAATHSTSPPAKSPAKLSFRSVSPRTRSNVWVPRGGRNRRRIKRLGYARFRAVPALGTFLNRASQVRVLPGAPRKS